MDRVEISPGGQTYPVFIGRGGLPQLGEQLAQMNTGKKVLLVSDTMVYPLYGNIARQSLEDAGFEVFPEQIKAGEESKNLDEAKKLYDHALEAELDRRSPIVALGGGMVGDLAGFVAATYLRGVPFVQVPTTLLAQVDSSVGGKVGVNHPRGKNLIGAFYQPQLVVIDPETLESLTEREYRAGVAEVIKYGFIGNREFFHWLEENLPKLLKRDEESLLWAVTTAVKDKAGVVEADEKEKGQRRILNLGHTFGHALESATGYSYYLHGEAVLAGMEMAVSLAEKLELLKPSPASRSRELLNLTGIKSPPEWLTTKDVMVRLTYDKKREGQTNVFVLPDNSGEAVIYQDPPEQMIEEVVDSYIKKFR